MKKLLLCAVLLYSALAQLCAQSCSTCEGGIIAQCPTGQGHDYRNVYMCFKEETMPTISESNTCKLAIVDQAKTSFTPHKTEVIHSVVKLIVPAIPGKSLRLGRDINTLLSVTPIELNQTKTFTFVLTPGNNTFVYSFCTTGACAPIEISPEDPTLYVPYSIDGNFRITYRNNIDAQYNANSRPDEIWNLSVGANDYDHPDQTPYTTAESSILAQKFPGSAHAYVKYGGTIGVLDKPLIFVDGIDFSREELIDPDIVVDGQKYQAQTIRHGSTGWDIFASGREESKIDVTTGQRETFNLYPAELGKLRAQGYDIILLDFANGSTYIEKNAELLIRLIDKVQSKTSAEIAVVGASMGGLVSRYALTKMEKTNNSHCVTHYISFDAPNQGANIPIFMQATAWTLYDYMVGGKRAVPDAWRSLNLPGSLQLLAEPFQSTVASGKVILERTTLSPILLPGPTPITIAIGTSTAIQADGFIGTNNYQMRNAFNTRLKNQGDYPSAARNLAIACGSGSGTPQASLGTTGGEKMYGLSLNADFTAITPTFSMASLGLFTVEGTNTPNLTFGQITATNWGIIPTSYSQSQYTLNKPRTVAAFAIPNVDATKASLMANCLTQPIPIPHVISARVATAGTFLPVDNAPGGFRDDLIRLVDDYVEQAKLLLGSNTKVSLVKSTPLFNTAFITTVSALDLKNVGLFDNISNLSQISLFQNKKTPFAAFYAPVGNLAHVELDAKMVTDFLLPQLKNFGVNNRGALTSTYNYGYQRNRITDITVTSSTGKLFINEEGATGFVSSAAEPATQNGTFDTYTSDCGPIYIQDNGEMRLGSTNTAKSGNVTINRNTSIEVRKGVTVGGNLNLYNSSTIFVGEGGNLKATQGNCTLKQSSQVVVQAGGIFTIAPQSVVTLKDNAKVVVEKGGKLVLSGNVVLNLADNSARIVVQNGGTLEVNGTIKVNGDGFIEFEQGNIVDVKVPALQLTGSGKNKRFIQINNNATLRTDNVSLYINTGAITYARNASVVVKNAPSIHINYVTANGRNDNEVAFNLLQCNGDVYVSNSDFNNLDRGFLVQNKQTGFFSSDYSTFSHCALGISSVGGGGNYLLSQNTTFLNNGIGCELRDQSGTIELWSTIFRYNNFGLHLSKNSQTVKVVSCTFTENHHVGILTEGTPSLVVSSGVFYKHNNDAFKKAEQFGLEVPSYNPPVNPCFEEEPCFAIYNADNSNIILTDGSLFKDNNYGVYKAEPTGSTGNPDALVIDCTTFDNNIYAVKGKDIEVMADAQLNQQTPNRPVRSNNFIQGKEGQFFFDICYGKLNNGPTMIYLRENYWETTANGAGNSPDPNLISFKEFCDDECTSCKKLGNCIPYSDDEFLPEPNKKCFPVGKPQGGGKTLSDEYLIIGCTKLDKKFPKFLSK